MSHSLIEGRFVVCAANKYGDLIVAGARHHDKVMNSQLRAIPKEDRKQSKCVQGFIDQYGTFMDRKEALTVAVEAGQINSRTTKTFPTDRLFSEDLY